MLNVVVFILLLMLFIVFPPDFCSWLSKNIFINIQFPITVEIDVVEVLCY